MNLVYRWKWTTVMNLINLELAPDRAAFNLEVVLLGQGTYSGLA